MRTIVLASGASLSLAGSLVILRWPVDLAWRVALVAGWCVFGLFEIVRMRRAYMTFRHIRVGAGGAITLGGRDDSTVAAELLAGSVLLGRLGWLRLKTADGRKFAELVYGNRRKNKQWRRLQVIWRHL